MSDQTFSERHGFVPQAALITIRQDAPYDLRGLIPRLAYGCGLKPSTVRELACTATSRAEDPNNWSEFPNIDGEVRDIVDQYDWFDVYDIIEAIAARLRGRDDRNFGEREDRVEVFTSRINRAFRKHGIGWQLIDDRIEVRGEEVFETVARPTIDALADAGWETTAVQLHEALKDLSRRPEPDITGAIHHAMAAVECLAREVTGDKDTLGAIIKRHPGLLPRVRWTPESRNSGALHPSAGGTCAKAPSRRMTRQSWSSRSLPPLPATCAASWMARKAPPMTKRPAGGQ